MVIKREWKRIPGVGIKEIYSIDDVVKAEIIFDYEKEKMMTIVGDLYNLIGFESNDQYKAYLETISKQSLELYNNKSW